MQKKTLNALRVMGKYLKQTEDKELKLRTKTDSKLMFTLFYQWIS